MMKHEFEELAGYEVSTKDYNEIIEPMYMATNMTKAEFVKCIDKKRFALPTKKQMVKEMKKIANHLYEICGHDCDGESERNLESMAHNYLKRFYGVDWTNNIDAYAYFNRGYEYPGMRGCSYPRELVLGYKGNEYERITLVKD